MNVNVKREARTQVDIAQIKRALNIKEEICQRHLCYECPLGELGVFETRTCDEIDRLINRLDLVYKVVETL